MPSINRKSLLKGITLGHIPAAQFYDYRLQQIFDGYKWDYQSGVQPTISNEVVLLDSANSEFLITAAEKLYAETVALENLLRSRKPSLRQLGLSDLLVDLLSSANYDADKHVRLMRFDFHPTTVGWRVSEVNSDVPAGFQEGSLHPQFAAAYFPDYEPLGNVADSLRLALGPLIPPGGNIAYVYDSHTVEDSQLFRFLGDYLGSFGYSQLHLEPNQVHWVGNTAEGIDAMVRHYPAEWLEYLPGTDVAAFINSTTVSVNHPIAVIAQSKRLPLVWENIPGSKKSWPAWRALLPKTEPIADKPKPKWIYKPAFGRVGEGINVPGTVSASENYQIKQAAHLDKSQWIQQKMFQSLPIEGLHLAIGVFVINGHFAGCFARASNTPIMNYTAMELPVLRRKHG